MTGWFVFNWNVFLWIQIVFFFKIRIVVVPAFVFPAFVSPHCSFFSVVSPSHKTSQIWTHGSFTLADTKLTWIPSVCCRHELLHHPVQFAAEFKMNSVIRKQHFPSDQLSFLICAAAFDHFFPPQDGIYWVLPQCFFSINHECLTNSDANSSSSQRLIFWLTAHCAELFYPESFSQGGRRKSPS